MGQFHIVLLVCISLRTISLKKILIYILICWFWRKLSIVCFITILTFTETDIFKSKKSNRKKVLLNTRFHSKKYLKRKKFKGLLDDIRQCQQIWKEMPMFLSQIGMTYAFRHAVHNCSFEKYINHWIEFKKVYMM